MSPPTLAPGGARSLTLPDDLQHGIARLLAGVPAPQWIREAQALSERYRGPRDAGERPLATGHKEGLGYLALIFPATYAQLRGAMAMAAARIPGWAPSSLLDLGSGPGTALWAATAQWPTLRSCTAWEREPALITIGRELAQQSSTPALRTARWERADLRALPRSPKERYDLVVIGHVLNELGPGERTQIVEWAWQATSGMLLIVEPGTSADFGVVRTARDQLLASGASTIAPCAHDQACPLQNDWCHFPQRLNRPEFQRRARGAPSQWEDSKFSFAAMARFTPSEPIWGRVIAEPMTTKAYAETLISTRTGVAHFRAFKRYREAFRQVRDLLWGAALTTPLAEPIIPQERST
jgi:ribosomal protein RSM22 (predicted rRNA methylase)